MTSGGSAYLIDTNVLIYAYDAADPVKQTRAIEVLKSVRRSGRGVLSVQVLGEFYVNVTRKPLLALTPEQARITATNLARSLPILDVTLRAYLDAVRGVAEHRLSYWDSLLWATAMQERVPFILTEDQQHRRLVEDVRYINPFLDDFDPERAGLSRMDAGVEYRVQTDQQYP